MNNLTGAGRGCADCCFSGMMFLSSPDLTAFSLVKKRSSLNSYDTLTYIAVMAGQGDWTMSEQSDRRESSCLFEIGLFLLFSAAAVVVGAVILGPLADRMFGSMFGMGLK
jgi:hypothetical protein